MAAPQKGGIPKPIEAYRSSAINVCYTNAEGKSNLVIQKRDSNKQHRNYQSNRASSNFVSLNEKEKLTLPKVPASNSRKQMVLNKNI